MRSTKYVASLAVGFALTLTSWVAASQTIAIPEAARNASAFDTVRAKFRTAVHIESSDHSPATPAPKQLFSFVHYPAASGALGGLLTPDPRDGKKHPAIIWITGGDCNSIGGEELSAKAPRSNDQTAAAYRKAGIVMFFPSLRGGNDNPGKREAFYGEIDDVLAAADYLAKQPYVDPDRIYLGGHSTGGTLALLTAEASKRFRAVFAFGPVSNATRYSQDLVPVDFSKYDSMETVMRLPSYWLPSIKSRVFVIEGTGGNIEHLEFMHKKSVNPNIVFLSVNGATHFSVLAPSNELIAQKILKDNGPNATIQMTEAELTAAHTRN